MPPRLIVSSLALGVALAIPARATAGQLIEFTGQFDGSSYSSTRFDGTNSFSDELPPLFDLSRLEGGSFSATFLVPNVPPVDGNSGFSEYQFDPTTPFALALLDPAGAVVHRIGGVLGGVDVENRRLPGRPPRPGPWINDVSFFAAPDGLGGLNAPPELYGPNELVFANIAAYFTGGTRPLGDLSIPTDAATYLDFADREFYIGLDVFNGDPTGDGPNLYVSTTLSYRITGASVAPAAVPEPSNLVLIAAGGLCLLGYARRRKAA